MCDGHGTCVGCLAASDCPGNDSDCATRTCVNSTCAFNLAAPGTLTQTQTAGDCQDNICDGDGGIAQIADDNDVANDGNPCTLEACTNGVPSSTPVGAGTSCNASGGTQCDGRGNCVGCLSVNDCPGTDTDCRQRTCNNGTCGVALTRAGTLTTTQVQGDCQDNVCDGNGNVISVADNNDVPNDNNPCTADLCSNGTPTFTPVASGTHCNGTLVCNSIGQCVGCNVPSDCPGQDTDCQARVCNSGSCGFSFTPGGSLTRNQTPGDCVDNVCDGNGGVTVQADNNDVPNSPSQCMVGICTAGGIGFANQPAGTSCTQNGGTQCDGSGNCVQCFSASDCPPSTTECAFASCTAGLCGLSFVGAGTPTSNQTAGDCRQNVCDGNGNIVSAVDNNDVPVDGLTCTQDVCTNGVPSNPPQPNGFACNQNGGQICVSGQCTFSVVVLRVGDGTAALSSSATAGFLETRYLDGTLVNTTNLPTASSGTNAPLTFSGTATSEGLLSNSLDGHYVTLAGYSAGPGTPNVTSSSYATINRVIGRLASNGALDTSTLITNGAVAGGNARSACTVDGSAFWFGSSTSGVEYVPFGASGGSAVLATPTNMRALAIFAGQIFGSSGSSPFTNVFTVGSGLPTTSGATATALPGMPTTSGSPYSFVFFDLNSAIPGVDTLYVADDRSVAAGGGVQKWTSNGSTWTLVSTLTNTTVNTGFRGLTGSANGSTVTLIATSTQSSANSLVEFVDNQSGVVTSSVIATAPTNTVFRGVAIAPH